jgi:hypothetical protein
MRQGFYQRSGKHVYRKNQLLLLLKKLRNCALSIEYNVKGRVGHVERFNPAFIAVKLIRCL